MNKLKSRFVTPYLLIATGIGIVAIYQLVFGGHLWGWLGAALTTIPIVGLLGRAMILQDLPRTSARLPLITGLAVLGMLISVFGYYLDPDNGYTPLVAAVIGLGGFLAYDFWYSSFGRKPSTSLQVGQPLPEFRLENPQGAEVLASTLRGRPVLFLFYRGNWCPLCMAQVKEIASGYRDLAALGAEIVLVSPQPHEETAKLAAKYDVPFKFLVDPGNRAAEQLGIAAHDGVPLGLFGYGQDTVMPTVIITDADGVIRYADQTDNYRVRPEPETFRHVLEGLTGIPRQHQATAA